MTARRMGRNWTAGQDVTGERSYDALREGIAAGLVQVEFTGAHAPAEYQVTITNGSGRKQANIITSRQSTAAGWGARFAAATGPGWYLTTVEGI